MLEEEGLACGSSESDSELESESDMDLNGEAEIRNEAVLLQFTSTLQKAQEVAVAAERKAWEMKRQNAIMVIQQEHFTDKLQEDRCGWQATIHPGVLSTQSGQ